MDQEKPSFVVGIGASAGGLEAIELMFEHMPDKTGMAFVIVQHLSPDFKSLMNELLSRKTSIPIHPVQEGMRVERDAIYLIPAKKQMTISDGHLLLTDKDPHSLTLPIDHFFRSLAQDCGRKAIAVVLSGTGSDGSRGVAAIHEAGGLVVAQREETAKFDGMPRGAHASGAVDLSLAPGEIPESLLSYAEHPLAEGAEGVRRSSLDEPGIQKMFSLIREAYGLDFNSYKLNTIVRRTERRMQLARIEHINAYAERLAEDKQELDLLYNDLLIGVTRFFRDREAFEQLDELTIKPLVSEAETGTELRIWVAGTATGEEAYSIAILLNEAISASGKQLTAKIFATDVHRDALEFAAQGIYSAESLVELEPSRLASHFTKLGSNHYKVSSELRRMIVFAPHNLVKDAPFTKMDLITCRNMLIYLQQAAQKRVLSLFHFGLTGHGVLMLGPSESAGDIAEEFDTLSQPWRIYRKRRDLRLPPDMRQKTASDSEASRSTGLPSISPHSRPHDASMLLSTYDAVLNEFMPTSLLISEDGLLMHTFGDAGSFFAPEQGRPTPTVVDRLIPELRVPASTLIRKALKGDEKVSFSAVPCSVLGGDASHCRLSASPLTNSRRVRSVLLQIEPVDPPAPKHDYSLPLDTEKITADQLTSLEAELSYTQENLQATIEELETSNEELQATNEELVASNEELQSTNEELHSVNEELYTVNAEHQNKINQLSELSRDMDKLLECTEVHTVFFDTDLRIRKFTPRIAKSFNILPQDIGRSIGSFTHSIDSESITEKIRRVADTGTSHEEEVQDEAGRWFLMRIVAYRDPAVEGENPTKPIDGVLLTLVDITKLRRTSEALRESVAQRDHFLAMLSHELRNPLATIVNATHLLSRSESPSSDAHDAEPMAVIKRQTKHMATLLDDLLDVTRVSHGKIRLLKGIFDLRHAVTDALESVQARCEIRKQTVKASMPDYALWIHGSEPRILQVLSNLLTNASKYSPDEAVIEIELDTDGPEARIVVRDQGMGVPLEQRDKIFELFVQSNRTLDRADGGLGIGLTLVKSLVELHDGRVTVNSEGEGTGTEFTVWLPLGPPPPEPRHADPMPVGSTAVGRVVLVEDNVDASKMLAFLLEDAGYQVSIANDGKRGLETIRSKQPDVAIVDVGLPELNGYELAKAVRESEGDSIYLIALTGYSQASDRADALEAGFDEHVAKPVDPELLSRLLEARNPAWSRREQQE